MIFSDSSEAWRRCNDGRTVQTNVDGPASINATLLRLRRIRTKVGLPTKLWRIQRKEVKWWPVIGAKQ